MDVLVATEITPAMLTSTNAPERLAGEVEWSDQAWPAGSLVTRTATHRVYRAVYDVPSGGVPPEENIATAMLPYWQDLRPMNQWAMFDGRVGTQTIGPSGDLVVVLTPGVTTDLWLGNLTNATGMRIVVKDKPGGDVVYDVQRDTYQPVTTWWDWWFGPFDLARDSMFTGIPAYRGCEITITIQTGGTAALGMAALGRTQRLGCTRWEPDTDFRNYAARQLDQNWGPSEGTGGNVTRDQNYTVIVDPLDAPRVSKFMESVMRRPAVWLPHGDPRFEGIRGFGQAVDARMRYPNPAVVELSISTRGFI